MMPILAITDKEDARVIYEALTNEWLMEWAKEVRDSEKTTRLSVLMVAAHAELSRLTTTDEGTDND